MVAGTCGRGGREWTTFLAMVIVWLAVVVPALAVVAMPRTVMGDLMSTLGSSTPSAETLRVDEDPCEGACSSAGMSCVVRKNGGKFCVNCGGLLRPTHSSSYNFEECCAYKPEKPRCANSFWRSAGGVCTRSQELFVHASSTEAPTRASLRGGICAKFGEFKDNGLACRLKKTGDGEFKCIHKDGSLQTLPCSKDLVEQRAAPDQGLTTYSSTGFGASLAMTPNGNRMAVGSPAFTKDGSRTNRSIGLVQVFEDMQDGSGWVQVRENLWGERRKDFFGGSVAISADGNRVAAGSYTHNGSCGTRSGHVRVFQLRQGSGWVQLGNDIEGEAADDLSGNVRMSADGNRLAVAGSGGNDGAGHVRVFEWKEEGEWVLLGANVTGKPLDDGFASRFDLSADGNRIAVGSSFADNGEDAWESGRVHVFEWQESEDRWVQLGNDLKGSVARERFGGAVALSADGNRLAVSGPNRNSEHAQPRVTIVRVFDWDARNGVWMPAGDGIEGWLSSLPNTKVALSYDGTRLAVGAWYGYYFPATGENRIKSDELRLFEWEEENSRWIQVGEDMNGIDEEEGTLGVSLALAGNGHRIASREQWSERLRVFETTRTCD